MRRGAASFGVSRPVAFGIPDKNPQEYRPSPHFPGLSDAEGSGRNDNHLQQGSADANCCRRSAFRWCRIVSGLCLVVQGRTVAGRAAPVVSRRRGAVTPPATVVFRRSPPKRSVPRVVRAGDRRLWPGIREDIRPFLCLSPTPGTPRPARRPPSPNGALESETDALNRTEFWALGRKR